jgi:hypothetical protein
MEPTIPLQEVWIMRDPRLNSIHLDTSRRQDFRRAREVLLQSRGHETIYAELHKDAKSEVGTTIIKTAQGKHTNAEHLEYWLLDREFIYPLKIGLNTVGRSSDNDVVVEDLYISRRHCAIVVHASRSFEIHDVASKNGTFLNGSKIPGPTPLKSGDEIRICNRNFVFMTKNEQESPNVQKTMTIQG